MRHESDLTITVEDNAFVMIDMFDDSKLSIVARDRSRVCINHYGGDLLHQSKGLSVIKVIEKKKKTY